MNDKKYMCTLCDKHYASASSLWNHNTKFHNKNSVQTIHNSKSIKKSDNNKKYNCSICNKSFKSRQNKWDHEQTCKNKNNKYEILEEKHNQLEKQFIELKAELEKTKTINSMTNSNNNNNNNTNINNGTIINNIVKFGDLSYDAIFNDKQIKNILEHKHKALEQSIIQTHFNDKLPELKNIFITNLRDNLAHIFDGKDISAITKSEAITTLIEMHSSELSNALEKYRDKITKTDADKVEEMLNDLASDEKFIDENQNKTYPNRTAYKGEQIKLLVYNKSDLEQFKKLLNGINKRFNLEIDIDITPTDEDV